MPLNPPTRPLRPAPRALPARARPAPSAAPRLVRLLLGLRRRDAAEVEVLVQKAHASRYFFFLASGAYLSGATRIAGRA